MPERTEHPHPARPEQGGQGPELTPQGEDKRAWRREIRRVRRELCTGRSAPDTRARAEAVAAAALTFLGEQLAARAGPVDEMLAPERLRGACVTAYEAMDGEPPTEVLLRRMLEHGVRVLVPHTRSDLDLDWRELTGDGGHSALLGLEAIAAADVVFTPGLAVSTAGTRLVRLGQGGGCYDRALPRRRAGTPVITLLHDHEVTAAALPWEPHDTPVDGTLTASRGVDLHG